MIRNYFFVAWRLLCRQPLFSLINTPGLSLLNSDFLRLILPGFAIAAPAYWWIMHQWLQNYAYRTSMFFWVFAISGPGKALIAIITFATQTCRSATENPIRSLRTEKNSVYNNNSEICSRII